MSRNFILLLVYLSLLSCSKKNNDPIPGNPGNGGTGTDTPTNVKVSLYPLPPIGWVGDVMPYYFNNEFHVFYLQDVRDGGIGYHPWDKFITKDLLNYDYKGEMIPLGKVGDQDLAIGTGSVIKAGDKYYAYYTGHNWQFQGTGRAVQGVMYATSTDLETWVKKNGFDLRSSAGYGMDDFRDPLVMYNEEDKEYMMLVSARLNGKGVLAKYTTQDLSADDWILQNPFYAPGTYDMLECSDLFKWGNYWYLIFSDTGPEHITHYRIGTSINGPWSTPEKDFFDGEYYYAAKTASDGQNRYIFGWISTKEGNTDLGKRDWGGNLAVHALKQANDGTLSVDVPSAIANSFKKEADLAPQKTVGNISQSGNSYLINAESSLNYSLFNTISGTYKITGTVSFDIAPEKFGFILGTADTDLNKYFRLGYDGSKGLVCDNYNFGNIMTESKVPYNLEAGKDHEIKLLIENSVCVLYVDNRIALSARIYNLQNNPWGIFSDKGTVNFKNLKIYKL